MPRWRFEWFFVGGGRGDWVGSVHLLVCLVLLHHLADLSCRSRRDFVIVLMFAFTARFLLVFLLFLARSLSIVSALV